MNARERAEKTIVEAEKTVAEARKAIAEVKKRLKKTATESVLLTRGKINKYGFIHLPKKFFEKTGLPRKVDIPVTIYLEDNQLRIVFSGEKS